MSFDNDMTARWRHRWYKVFPLDDLFSPLRHQLGPAERGIWYDIRSLAAIQAVPGTICDSDSQPMPRTRIAALLNVRPTMLEATLKTVIALGLCTEDDAGIHISNWQQSQSEYDRQKPYREGKKRSQDPDKYAKGRYEHLVGR